ncbi:MAG: sulfatase-like hydrolase/transferase, partial [Planctomycetia bacterium]|nr:sulfatase-like hydrolase/transferase [Planctomycetia bacterium]
MKPHPLFQTFALCIALIVLSVGTAIAADAKPTRPPNIILLLTDDQGYGDLSCYNDQSKVSTPHIDQLASDGIRFTDAHTAASVCTPSRFAILTGCYAWRSRLKLGVL